jgi:hypothetical protein
MKTTGTKSLPALARLALAAATASGGESQAEPPVRAGACAALSVSCAG